MPAWSWTGPYAGLIGGYGWADGSDNLSDSGWIGGGFLGYNLQTNQNLVVGLDSPWAILPPIVVAVVVAIALYAVVRPEPGALRIAAIPSASTITTPPPFPVPVPEPGPSTSLALLDAGLICAHFIGKRRCTPPAQA